MAARFHVGAIGLAAACRTTVAVEFWTESKGIFLIMWITIGDGRGDRYLYTFAAKQGVYGVGGKDTLTLVVCDTDG